MSQDKTNLQEAKKHVEGYVTDHLQLAKLEMAERTAKVAASVAVSLSTAIMMLTVVGFLSFAAAFYLGELLSGYHWGFLCVGGFYSVIFAAYALLGKSYFHRVYTNSIIKKMFQNHD